MREIEKTTLYKVNSILHLLCKGSSPALNIAESRIRKIVISHINDNVANISINAIDTILRNKRSTTNKVLDQLDGLEFIGFKLSNRSITGLNIMRHNIIMARNTHT